MDKLICPPLRMPIPRAVSWLTAAAGFVVAFLGWWVNDLWRLATWPTHQFDLDDSMERHKMLKLASFALVMAVAIAVILALAYYFGWPWYEWVSVVFVLAFLYCVATGIRISA